MHLVTIGGSDAGISAALRAREAAPSWDVTVLLADAYPNFSICGLPYYLSGDVPDWRRLAHRTAADLAAAGIEVRPLTRVDAIDPVARSLQVRIGDGRADVVAYDALVIGTGAVSVVPPIEGLTGPDALGPRDGVHTLRTMDDAHAVMATLIERDPNRAVIVGAGYIGLEMAEALTVRGVQVTQIEALPEVLPTLDPELGALVHAELQARGVEVLTGTTVRSIAARPAGVVVRAEAPDGTPVTRYAEIVLVVVGVRPDVAIARQAGAQLGARGAIQVDRRMATGVPDVFAAGDCAITHHRLLGDTWLPLGTTAHKQGRAAGENAVGGHRRYPGSLGTQVVKVFDLVAARTGVRDAEAADRWAPLTVAATADDHKAYYPGATPIRARITGDTGTGRLLGAQLVGHLSAEVAKRIDVLAAGIHQDMTVDAISDLDLSYTPPLGSPWDAVQLAAQQWVAAAVLGH